MRKGTGRWAAAILALSLVGAGLVWSLSGPEVHSPSTEPPAESAGIRDRSDVRAEPDALPQAVAALDPPQEVGTPPAETAARGVVTGTLAYVDADRDPAPGVLVVLLRPVSAPTSEPVEISRTDSGPDGRFRIEGVPDGTWGFRTRTQEGEPWDPEHVTVTVVEGRADPVELWVERPLPPGTGFTVKGTVKYDDGAPVGEFRFALDRDDRSFSVAGRDGRFERRLPSEGEYTVHRVEGDGEVWDSLWIDLTVTEGETLEVKLHRPGELVVEVVDRGTGAGLAGALAYPHRWEDQDFVFDDHPNGKSLEGEPLVADGRGRIALGRGTGSETIFVTAPGHEWRRVETGPERGTQRVELGPGGGLRLTVTGWSLLEGARVSMSTADPWRRWALPVPGDDGIRVYDGLPPGDWTVRVRRGFDFQDGEIYGTGTVTITAGTESTLILQTTPSKAGAPVSVRGTVSVDPAWKRSRTHVTFEGADPTNRDISESVSVDLSADGAPVPFELRPIPPGRYEVDIDPQWYLDVEVPDDGGEFEFKLPAPGTVRVRVVDDVSGELVPGASVSWHMDVGRSGYGLESADRGDLPGTFRLVAPPGRVALSVDAPGYVERSMGGLASLMEDGESDGVVVETGETVDVTLRLKRATEVVFTFLWEGSAPDWEAVNAILWYDDEDGGSFGRGLQIRNGKAVMDSMPPGELRLSVSFEGGDFEDIDGLIVRSAAGEKKEVEVTLARRKQERR